jgi:D-alanine-D-alanine ligase
VAASAVCMNKVLFKRLMRDSGAVPQVDFVGVREETWGERGEEVLAELAQLGMPVFVKPAQLGSSLGIVKVTDEQQLGDALGAAFAHDELAIVEAAAPGIEVECGVLGRLQDERDSDGAEALASEPGEIVLAGGWYDFESKYEPGGMQLQLPARISATAAERVRELAVMAFAFAGCAGLARVDFFVDGEQVLVNELNTMPGFTPTSVYAKLLERSGVSYAELVERLCRLALERRERSRAHKH